jgi:hypothetical protein
MARELLHRAISEEARIYWNPGVGVDLTTLLLLPDHNWATERVFRPDRPAKSPLLLWGTDHAPVDRLIGDGGNTAYPHLWAKFGASIHISGSTEISLGPNAPGDRHWLLDADLIRNNITERHCFIYSQGDANLFPAYFEEMKLSPHWVAFIRTEAFAGTASTGDLMPRLLASIDREKAPSVVIGDGDVNLSKWQYIRLGSLSPLWFGQFTPANRIRSGGVRGWGQRDRFCLGP